MPINRLLSTRRPLMMAPQYVGPYDSISSGMLSCWSLRRCLSTYNGPAIRIRRASDNDETDISFKDNGDIDIDSIASFINATTGHVKTWYDQTPNSKHLDQPTLGNQPYILLNQQNGLPGVDFLAANSQRLHTTDTTSFYNNLHSTGGSVAFVTDCDNSSFSKYIIGNGTIGGIGNNGVNIFRSATEHLEAEVGRVLTDTNGLSVDVVHGSPNFNTVYIWMTLDPDNLTAADRSLAWENGSSLSGTNALTNTPNTGDSGASLFVGRSGSNTLSFDGRMFEVVIWNDIYSSYRLAWQDSVSAYWSI